VRLKNGTVVTGRVLEKLPGPGKMLMLVETERFIDFDSIRVHLRCRRPMEDDKEKNRERPELDKGQAGEVQAVLPRAAVRFLSGVRGFDDGRDEAAAVGLEIATFERRYGQVWGWEWWDSENGIFKGSTREWDREVLTAHSVYWGPMLVGMDRDRSVWFGGGGGLLFWEIEYHHDSGSGTATGNGGFLFTVFGFGIRVAGDMYADFQARYSWPQFKMDDLRWESEYEIGALEGYTAWVALRGGVP
jgi:hypothetical protein